MLSAERRRPADPGPKERPRPDPSEGVPGEPEEGIVEDDEVIDLLPEDEEDDEAEGSRSRTGRA